MRKEGAGKHYVIDNPIVVGAEWEGISSNQSLPVKEVGRENVQNPALRGQFVTNKPYTGVAITYLECEGPVHPSDVRVPLLINCTGVH